MAGETNLVQLLKGISPQLNKGEFVFVTVKDTSKINRNDTIGEFKECEGTTLIIERQKADVLNLEYHFIASWITLNIHSALEAVGLTAAISTALTEQNISCNIVAGYYHDHIFVAKRDANSAMNILRRLSENYK